MTRWALAFVHWQSMRMHSFLPMTIVEVTLKPASEETKTLVASLPSPWRVIIVCMSFLPSQQDKMYPPSMT